MIDVLGPLRRRNFVAANKRASRFVEWWPPVWLDACGCYGGRIWPQCLSRRPSWPRGCLSIAFKMTDFCTRRPSKWPQGLFECGLQDGPDVCLNATAFKSGLTG